MSLRTIYCADSVEYMRNQSSLPYSIITSLPDAEEIGFSFPDWENGL
jgi:hypothetical protein